MTRDERDAPRRRILSQRHHVVEELTGYETGRPLRVVSVDANDAAQALAV